MHAQYALATYAHGFHMYHYFHHTTHMYSYRTPCIPLLNALWSRLSG